MLNQMMMKSEQLKINWR